MHMFVTFSLEMLILLQATNLTNGTTNLTMENYYNFACRTLNFLKRLGSLARFDVLSTFTRRTLKQLCLGARLFRPLYSCIDLHIPLWPPLCQWGQVELKLSSMGSGEAEVNGVR